ncbi:MAG: 23S rRNA (adenine(2503)-C(2))-methyltransferase RlmN, partial [Candidatus Omnitrophota bacterium]|nr:23S rRNA (adenine(2503)-C(2))-methyltransferase RlmN [Candidatus Omnitrophota bacterium]
EIEKLTLQELEGLLAGWGYKPFYAREIFRWIYGKLAEDFAQMTSLPLGLRDKLKENFSLRSLKLITQAASQDGTRKFLFALSDKSLIEAVLIPAQGRVTGCISSQAGCKFACRFCASGSDGFQRNLSAGEILDQVLCLKKTAQGKLTHIVFMGTGEPLDNYENVLEAARMINSPFGFNIGARRITISTCGIAPAIEKLAREELQIELSVSLHAADDQTRNYLMPVNKKYPLKELLRACSAYIQRTNRQITFEYVLIQGVNSGLQNAKNLSRILKGLKLAKVNLIPANPLERLKIAPPDRQDMLLFKNELLKSGIPVTLRKPRGKDIEAACGQLRLRYEKK